MSSKPAPQGTGTQPPPTDTTKPTEPTKPKGTQEDAARTIPRTPTAPRDGDDD